MANRWFGFFAIVLVSVGIFSCSPKLHKPDTGDDLVIYPPPPDTTRLQFLTRISTSEDVTGKPSGFMNYVVGDKQKEGIIKPYGIAIHNGKIYICDTIFAGLEIIDLQKKRFDYFQPRGYGQLKKPINCSVDAEGKLYVTDSERRQVVVFDENLKYLAHFGDAKALKPIDVFIYEDKIYVSDIKNHRVNIYKKGSYELLKSFPQSTPESPDYLHSPTNIYVLDGLLYVSDFGEFNIKIYTVDGKYLRSIGSYGRNLGQFVRPKGIAVDRWHNLYVVDTAFENVQIFDAYDRFLMFFGGTYKGRGDMWLPAKVVIDYDNLDYFRKYVHDGFDLKYLVFVTNQYGPDKIGVYGYVGPVRRLPEKEKLTRKN